MPETIDIYDVDSGKISKEILKPGHGELIVPGSLVYAHYTATLVDGTKFDSSRDRYGTFIFRVGIGDLITGLDIGICSMRKEEHAVLTIDSKYAFGPEGNLPAIQPDTVLKFDVEILDWKYEDSSPHEDGTVEKRIVTKAGIGYLSPKDGAYVQVHITGTFKSKVLEDRDVIFCLGDGESERVAKGVELALKKFKLGEKSTIFMTPKHAVCVPYIEEVNAEKFGFLEYEIELKCFETSQPIWSMSSDTKIRKSEMFKEKGNQFFKQQSFQRAIKMYEKVVLYLEERENVPINTDENCTKLLLSAHLNLSLSFLKVEDFKSAKESALKAIDLAPNNDKAHYRCGLAHLELLEYEKARDQFEICLKLDPNNSEAKAQLFESNKNIKKRKDTEKKRYENMFGRLAGMSVEDTRDETAGGVESL